MKLTGITAAGVAAIVVAAPAFAQLPDPTKSLPKVPVPTVQVPVPVPTVQVPVPVPTVRVPVPVPTVQAPVPVPTVAPQIPPVVSGGGGAAPQPSAGGGGGGSGGGSSSGGSSSRSGGGSSGGGAASGGSSRAGSAGSGAPSGGSRSASAPDRRRSTGASAGGSTLRRSSSGSRRAAPRRVAGRVERREHQLRRNVVAARGCLEDLSRPQRRVLVLRAGIGAGPPRSRPNVARRLEITVRRVVRLERTGLQRLGTLARTRGCAPAKVSTVTSGAPPARDAASRALVGAAAGAGKAATGAVGAAADRGAAAALGSGVAEGEPGGDRGRGSRDGAGRGEGGAGGDRDSSGGAIAGTTRTSPPETASEALRLGLPLIVLALVLAAFMLARVLRSEPQVAWAAAPDDPEPEPQRRPWVPWHKSTMDGPGWTSAPPSSDEGSWASAPEDDDTPDSR